MSSRSVVKQERARTMHHGVRYGVNGMLLLLALLTVGVAQAQSMTQLRSVGLPTDLVVSLERAVTLAMEGAEERLLKARVATDLSRLRNPLTFSPGLDVAWSAVRDRDPRADVLATVRGFLLNPVSWRDAVRADQLARDAALQALIRETELQRNALLAWLSLWRTTQQVHLLNLLAAAPPPRTEPAATDYHALLDHRDRLAFDAMLQRDMLTAASGSGVAWLEDPHAWDPFLGMQIDACAEGDVNVLLRRESLHAALGALSVEASSRRLPVVQVGADLGWSFSGDASGRAPALEGWVEVGAPSMWPVEGSLRLAQSSHETRLSLRLAPSQETFDAPLDLSVEAAEGALEEAVRAASRSLSSASFDLDRLQADLPSFPSLVRPSPVTVDAVEVALAVVDQVAYGVELQWHRLLACERERVWGARSLDGEP